MTQSTKPVSSPEETKSSAKKNHESRSGSRSIAQAMRRVLKWVAEPESNCDDTWAEKLSVQLFKIACSDVAPANFHALRIAIEILGERALAAAKRKKGEDCDVLLPPMTEEQLDSEIAELETQLAALESPRA